MALVQIEDTTGNTYAINPRYIVMVTEGTDPAGPSKYYVTLTSGASERTIVVDFKNYNILLNARA